MGRRPDPPADQAAKGHPGKRRSKVEKQLANAVRLAELLAAAPPQDGEVMSPPAFLDERSAPALAVWRALAPSLVATHRLTEDDRFTFAQFCVYYGEWVTAREDLMENGFTQKVKTVAGGYMERQRPAYAIRERAFDNVLKLSEDFGLTPRERYALFKDQAAAGLGFGNLFPAGGQQQPSEPKADGDDDLIGGLSRLDSPPPGARPN